MLPDTAAGQIEWKLSYQELADAEVQSLSDLFTASQGEFARVYVYRSAGESAGLERGSLAAGLAAGVVADQPAGVTDPLGTQRASSVTNASAGTQALQQTLGVSGDYVACFSAYVRSDAAGTVTLQRDGTARRGGGGSGVEARLM